MHRNQFHNMGMQPQQQQRSNIVNNTLLNGYHNYQMNNIPFQRNALLNNNPNFKQFISQYSPYDEKARHNNIYQQMNKLKSLQQIKQMEKYNDLEKFVDKDALRESVIKPIKVVKPVPGKIINDYTIIKQHFEPNNPLLHQYWNSRTNQAYKNILNKENYAKIPLKGAKKEDLIVHRVTDADKIGLMDEFEELNKILEKHDDELKVIYSSSKEAEYKAQFIHHNASKFRIKYDPSDFKKLKKDRIKYYQKEQKNLERNMKKVEDLIEAAILSGSFSEKEIKELESSDKSETTLLAELQDELKRELGDEYDEELIKNILSQDNADNNKKYSDEFESDDDSNNEENTKLIKKQSKNYDDNVEIIEIKPIKKTSNNIIIKGKIGKQSSGTNTISEDVKEKYRMRQKKT